MKIHWVALLMTVAASTLIILVGSVGGFFIPNLNLPSDSLWAELAMPVTMASFFSLIAGYVASRPVGRWRSGALGGAINALINLGVLLLVLSLWDRHFIAIGGRGLVAWFPLAALIGAAFGALGAGLKQLLRARTKPG